MDQDAAHMMAASKDVIENGPTLTKTQVVEGVETVMPIIFVEDKAQKRLEVKARSTLMVGISNEHQLKFNSIKDAKKLMKAIEKRFSGNAATKKTHRNLLKQQYENFTASNIEMLDQTFDRLQKLTSQLELLGKKISQEDVNQKLLRSLSPEWNTHVVVWRNKSYLDTLSMNDLYNNLKMTMLTMRARRFLKNTGRKLNLNGNETISFDKTKSDQVEDGPNYALMAYSTLSSNSEKSKLMVLGYKASLKSVEERLDVFKTNESIYSEDIKKLKFEIHCNKITIKELRKKLETIQKEKDGIQLTIEKLKNALKSLNKLIDSQIVDNCKKGLGYNAVPPPHTSLFMPPKPDLSYIGLEEFTSEPAVETLNAKTSEDGLKVVKNDNGTPIIEDWKSDDEDESVPQPKIEKKTVKPSVAKEKGVIDSGCSRHMTGNMSYLTDYEEIDGGYVAFGGNPKGGKVTGKGTIRTDKLDLENVYFIKELKFNLFTVSQICDKKNSVLFNDTEYVVLSPDFKLTDENHVLLRVPRKKNMYSVDLQNIIPKIAERRNMTLIKAVRTMLADSKLPTTFWAEAVNIACYVQNRVLVTKPHNKIPYELFHGRTPMLSFMRPFGCPVTILNTIDHLGKFDGKADEGFFVGYSLNSKAFRVFNSRTRIVEETLHFRFSKNTPNNVGSGPNWLFDIDALTKTMKYQPVVAGTQTIGNAGTKDDNNAGQARKEKEPGKDYILLPLWTADLPFPQEPKSSQDVGFKPSNDVGNKVNEVPKQENECKDQEEKDSVNSTNRVNVASSTVNAPSNEVNDVGIKSSIELPNDPNMPELEEISIFEDSNEDVFGVEADLNNLESTFQVNPISITRIYKDHPLQQVIGDLHSGPQTRRMLKNLEAHGLVSTVDQRTNHKDLQNCLYACFLSQMEPKKGHTQEEGIDCDEVFAPVARIEAIRLFLAYSSFKDLMVYQMDVKSAFLYVKIEQEVYVCQPTGFEDLNFPDKVYKVDKALYGLHQAPRACDYAGASLDRKSTIGGCQFLGCRLISWQFKKQTVVANSTTEAEYVVASNGKKVVIFKASIRRDLQFEDEGGVDSLPNEVIFEQLTLMGAKTTAWNEFSSIMASAVICLATNQKFNFSKYIFDSMKPKKTKRNDTQVPQLSVPTESVIDEAVNEEMSDSLERATTTATSLDAEQVRGNINKTQSKTTLNEPSSIGTSSGSGPRRQDTMGDTIAQTSLQNRVLALEATKTSQAQKIDSLTRRVKKLKMKQRSITYKLKRLYKVGLSARVESSEEEGLEMFDANKDLQGEEVVVEQEAVANKEPIVDAVQAKLDADYQLAERMQEEEQQELNEEEKAKLFMELLEKRRKLFATKRAKEKRNRPPTKAQ
uniref:Uncharacterized protein n=1 Tax=Tanacetum cinerariifolium TaxID=118510 RepID=A0A699GPB3_TANCI|nr:hypothetical protein [Tanacetum cinerariifolium]